MSLTPPRRARLIRSGFVLLASLAVATATLATSAQPARAGVGDLGCLPSNDYPDYSIAVAGPTASGPAQPINAPVKLTLVGSGGQVFVGRAACSVADYDVDV